jgi:putative flavoprotein involved in K+ transport
MSVDQVGANVHHADCIVVGAGPAGLAAAHELMRVGRRVLVLEGGAHVAMSWRAHRPGLRLHTVRLLSGLPGLPIPRTYGRYVTSANLVRYLDSYTARSEIDVRFGVAVSRIEQTGRMDAAGQTSGWAVVTADGTTYTAGTVVVATGYNRVPAIPDLPGLENYKRPYLHVADYRGGDQFAGLDVLVVGAGNAAAEAATELVAAGARRVSMAVRTPPHIVRRRVWGISMQTISILLNAVPLAVADRVARVLSWLTIPDLSAKKMERPRPDLFTRVARDRSVPVHDTGIVALLESDSVTPVAAVAGFQPHTVRLADGSFIAPAVVVFATGYQRGLENLVGALGLLDDAGNPRARSGAEAAPGLYFAGFTVSATGALRQLAGDARRIAHHVSRHDGPSVTRVK